MDTDGFGLGGDDGTVLFLAAFVDEFDFDFEVEIPNVPATAIAIRALERVRRGISIFGVCWRDEKTQKIRQTLYFFLIDNYKTTYDFCI